MHAVDDAVRRDLTNALRQWAADHDLAIRSETMASDGLLPVVVAEDVLWDLALSHTSPRRR